MRNTDYIVMGAWAVHAKNGKIRHRPCRSWCDRYNEDNEPFHVCVIYDIIDDIPIPEMVVTVSKCLREKVTNGTSR